MSSSTLELIPEYNMVLSLSMQEVNQQLESLYEQKLISSNFDVTVPIIGDIGIKFTGEVAAPVLSAIPDQPQSMMLKMTFISGTAELSGAPGTPAKADLAGTTYAFTCSISTLTISGQDIQEGKVKLVSDSATKVAQSLVKQATDNEIPAQDFLIQSLFTDFDNSNILDYSQQESTFSESLIAFEKGNNAQESFPAAMNLYFQKNAPYVLSYSNVIQNQPPQNTNAEFKPTYADFSTTYVGKNSPANSLNILMMVNDNKPPKEYVSAPSSPLLSADSAQGVLAVPYNFFSANQLNSIISNIESCFSSVLSTLSKEKEINSGKSSSHNGIFGSTWGKIKTSASFTKGSLTPNGDYAWSCTPWEIDISSSAQNNSSIGWGSSHSNSWTDASYSEKDLFSANVEIQQSSIANGLIDIVISLNLNSSQSVDAKSYVPGTIFSGLKPIEVDHYSGKGNITTTTSPQITISMLNGKNGKFEFEITRQQGSFDSKPVKLGKVESFADSFQQNIKAFQNSAEQVAEQLQTSLQAALDNMFATNIILPLGQVFEYSDLRFYTNPDQSTSNGADNAILNTVKYIQ